MNIETQDDLRRFIAHECRAQYGDIKKAVDKMPLASSTVYKYLNSESNMMFHNVLKVLKSLNVSIVVEEKGGRLEAVSIEEDCIL